MGGARQAEGGPGKGNRRGGGRRSGLAECSAIRHPLYSPNSFWCASVFLDCGAFLNVSSRAATPAVDALALKPVMKQAVKRLDWKDGTRHNVPVPGQFRMFPTGAQIEAFKVRGYLVASLQFDARREQFERLCA